MRFERELDSLVRIVVEEKLEVELKDNHVVIAECRTRKEYNVDEDNRYGIWLEENIVSHVKILNSGAVYTVSYSYIATSKTDDIRDIKLEQLGNEEEIIEITREQYRNFDEEAIEVDVDNVRMKVIKKRLKRYTKENSIALNF